MKLREILQIVRIPRRGTGGPLRRCHDLEDLRATAQGRLPRSVFDYVDGWADEERSLRGNRESFAQYQFLPRSLINVEQVNVRSRVLGAELPVPLGLAPTGYTRMVHPEGERAVARAAAARDLPYVLSTVGTTTIEDVAREELRHFWFQLYVLRDRGLTWALLERATAAGVTTLEVSVDVAVAGNRVRDVRNGFTIPPSLTVRTLADIAIHFRYWLQMVSNPALTFANIAPPTEHGAPTIADISALFDPTVTWDDLAAIRTRWPGRLVLKGPVSPADAGRAVELGVDGVHLSNHGGRQLDRTIAPLDLIRPVRERVGEQAAIVVDSGFRHGADVLVALARGADLCMVGRPYLYGLAAGGSDGVTWMVDLLVRQLERTMQLCGLTSIDDIRAHGDSVVVPHGGVGSGGAT